MEIEMQQQERKREEEEEARKAKLVEEEKRRILAEHGDLVAFLPRHAKARIDPNSLSADAIAEVKRPSTVAQTARRPSRTPDHSPTTREALNRPRTSTTARGSSNNVASALAWVEPEQPRILRGTRNKMESNILF
eukprot:NODE_8857_length_536_cov_21.885086_g8834_i0.p2 GENE.NODE_8857_length_536_cov_21.885086_g8834_i0~~NODE_8857_length_536_cov_21.885086_g8834_i0.p2  ORF type:complete len:144 (+),score=44.27 NODE_8857_length_536_cov_21.885086_g8834_i0:30-434(+)